MSRLRASAALLALCPLVQEPARAELYAIGSFCSTCQTAGTVNQFYDDGLHGDGAAGDGLFGADVVVDQPAGAYSWFAGAPPFFSGLPYCWCASPPYGLAGLWTTGPGDVIHFTYDTRPTTWLPNGPAVATNRGRPSSSPFEVGIGFDYDPIWSPPRMVVPTTQTGSIWEAIALIPAAGTHFYAFYGGTVFTLAYNANCGCYPGEQPAASFTTSQPNIYVRLQFDESLGRMRSEVLGSTPTQRASWGSIKSLYR